MQKLIIAIISMALATASCSVIKNGRLDSVKAEKLPEQKTKTARPPLTKAAIGDLVVARWGPHHWAEGRVGSINGNEARILWAGELSPSEVDMDEVFVMSKAGSDPQLSVGDYTVVRSGDDAWWEPAVIREINGTTIKAKVVESGEIENFPVEKILLVSEKTAAAIEDIADQHDFEENAHGHRPAAPVGYTPKVGDHILGEWTTHTWHGGKVKSVSDGKALIDWENGMKPDEAPFEKLIPYPTAADSAQAPKVGDFVLLKPSNGNTRAAWIYGQVTAVNGSGIEAKDVDSTRDYKAGDFIVLEK